MGSCTRCHQLRKAGVDPLRCLSCHEPLAARIAEGEGYHGRLTDPECGECHKEHLGRGFLAVRFEPDAFDHDSTGYTLRGRHRTVECRSCHRPEFIITPAVRRFKGEAGALARTFLGLGTECASCHATDDPHGTQFSDRGCDDCHGEEGWEATPGFDHSRADYVLSGAHREVECEGCHRTEEAPGMRRFVRFRPVDFSDCRSCHEDPHVGAMPGRCDGCHVTQAWARVRLDRVEAAFDHASTGFPLQGAHADAVCESCHDPRVQAPGLLLIFRPGDAGSKSYPRPRFETCGSCHLDVHEGVFEGRSCEACHGQRAWVPSEFGLERHDRESRFELTGAHRVTPCEACHRAGAAAATAFLFRFENPEDCRTCHREDDPHEGAFGDAACQVCHGTGTFSVDAFDHDRPELGPWIRSCGVCHDKVQPHGDQFAGRGCGDCHGTESFRIPEFDHSATRFPLDGAHQEVACGECHRRELGSGTGAGGMVRYRPMETACSPCHAGEGRGGSSSFWP